jgi:hypothetical protein
MASPASAPCSVSFVPMSMVTTARRPDVPSIYLPRRFWRCIFPLFISKENLNIAKLFFFFFLLCALNDGWISTHLISSCPELREPKLRARVNSFCIKIYNSRWNPTNIYGLAFRIYSGCFKPVSPYYFLAKNLNRGVRTNYIPNENNQRKYAHRIHRVALQRHREELPKYCNGFYQRFAR